MNPHPKSSAALRSCSSSAEWTLKVKPPHRAASEPDRVSTPPPPPRLTAIDFDSVDCAEALSSAIVIRQPTTAGVRAANDAPGSITVTCRNQNAHGYARDAVNENGTSSNTLGFAGLRMEAEEEDKSRGASDAAAVEGESESRREHILSRLQNGKARESYVTICDAAPHAPSSESTGLQRRPKKRNWSGSGQRKSRRRREDGQEPGPLLQHRFKSVSGPTVRVLSDEFVHNRRFLPNNSDSILHRAGFDDLYADPVSRSSVYVTPSEGESPPVDRTQSTGSVPGHQSAGIYLREQIISFFQPSDNKLAMKLFGNKKALMVEKQRQKSVARWIIHPCSNFR